LAAVRRALRDRDRRSRPVPTTRQPLGRAAAIEAISLTESYTTLIDSSSGRLSHHRARRTADRAA